MEETFTTQRKLEVLITTINSLVTTLRFFNSCLHFGFKICTIWQSTLQIVAFICTALWAMSLIRVSALWDITSEILDDHGSNEQTRVR